MIHSLIVCRYILPLILVCGLEEDAVFANGLVELPISEEFKGPMVFFPTRVCGGDPGAR